MKLYFFIPFFLLFEISQAQVKKISAESIIQNVIVFSSGARIERVASVTILPGRSEITFSGLSNQLDQQSVQLKADAGITLLSVQTTKDFLSVRKIEQEEQAYIDRLYVLNDKIEMDNKLLNVYRNEEQMVIKNEAIGGQAGVKALELKGALDLHRQRLTEIYQKELEIQKRLKTQQQEAQKLKSQLQEFSKKRDSINYVVTALVESRETKAVKMQLLYNINDAGWYTTYDVRVIDVATPLTVLMNANVFQRSGETWKDINLTLSTGNPKENATPSQLQPWKLGFYDPSVSWRRNSSVQAGTVSGRLTNDKGEPIAGATVMIKGSNIGTVTDGNGFFKLNNLPPSAIAVLSAVGYQSKEVNLNTGYVAISLQQVTTGLDEVVVIGYSLQGKVAGVAVNEDEGNFKRKKEEIKTVPVATQYQPTTTVYKIEDKYTLETNGKTSTIGIKQFSLPAIYEYYTAPKVDQTAFLTGKIINWQDYDLQSGEANLYFEGSFLGKTYIDLAAVTDTLLLSLGKDNGVKISRRLVKEYSAKRFIGSNKTESRQFEIDIKNNKKVPVTIVVNDQFPVSISKEIDVEDITAPDAKIDKESGLATWMLTLESGQEKKLKIGYTIKYPKDKKVILE